MATLSAEHVVATGTQGMVTAPHHLAAEAGAALLAQGANAVEAAIGVSAALTVVYPHMTGLGGDGFWLISDGNPDKVLGLAAAGPAGRAYTPEVFRERGEASIPFRGGLSAMTVPGLLAGWEAALEFAHQTWAGHLSWSKLLAPAMEYAHAGVPVSGSLARTLEQYGTSLATAEADFGAVFLPNGDLPKRGAVLRQEALGDSLATIAREGPRCFYAGSLAAAMLPALRDRGSLLTATDLHDFAATWVEPLQLPFAGGTLFNLPPPSQGLASLMLAGMLENLPGPTEIGEAEWIHLLVEATKQVFALRDEWVIDPHVFPAAQSVGARFLRAPLLQRMAHNLQPGRAMPIQGARPGEGDTTWFAVVDAQGRIASVIQSLYHEFGTGVLAGKTGILWNNRGCAFTLDPRDPRCLVPGKRPFHTLNPAMYAREGRIRMAYGTMGGDGQPQTQAAILHRHVLQGLDVGPAVDAPRWLFGRTWGQATAALRLEQRFAPNVLRQLRQWGHVVHAVPPYSDLMGHAGILSDLATRGVWHGASDPRSDGGVATS